MANKAQIKQKQALVTAQSFGLVVTDLLLLINSDLGGEEVQIEEVARASQKLVQRLKNQYKRQVQREELVPRQRDLESLIEEMKKEKEHGNK